MGPRLLVAPLLLLVLASCGGGSKTIGTGASPGVCAPSGAELSITVMDTRYDKGCLAAPTSSPFTIRFDNEDSNTHNLDIRDGAKSLFAGQIVIGPKVVTYDVTGLPAGVYMFRCDVHPAQMHGTFVVSG